MSPQATAIEQLVPGCLEATDSTAIFGSVLMSRVGSNLPVTIRMPGLPGWTSYVVPELTCSVYSNGIRCGSEHCLVAGHGADLELICRTPADVIVCRIGARPGTEQRRCHLAGNAAELCNIRAIISLLNRPLDKYATTSHVTPLHKATFADLRDSLAHVSAASIAAESLSGNRRALSIERGRRYIHDNLVGALRIASVCEAAGVRSRTLEYGFRELFGISPVSYIKALRLNHVRRLLLSPRSAGRTITAIALDSGFWHLSQFAADYQKFFGESPSITRRRSLATTEWITSTSVSQSNGLLRQAAAPSARHFS